MKIDKNSILKSNIPKQNKQEAASGNTNESKEFAYPNSGTLKGYALSKSNQVSMRGNLMKENREEFITLRDKFGEKLLNKQSEAELKAWDFYTNSTDENMKSLEVAEDKLHELFKDEELYNKFSKIEKHDLGSKHLNRQLSSILRNFKDELGAGDIMKEMRNKENQISAKFNSYVPKIDEKEVSKAEISKILETENNPEIRKKAYNAKVQGGELIADDLVDLVKTRNEFAKSQGYENFFEYQVKEGYGVEPKELDCLLDEMYQNAKDSSLKTQMKSKAKLSKAFGINPEDLMAYHYGLLTDDSPAKVINDSLKTKEQVVDITKQAYKDMGYDVDSMPVTLDLFPRKNKNTHGFCFEITPAKDSRILANLTNNVESMDTLSHELGHCVYNLGIDSNLSPYEQATYPAMTEAVAMMMGDLPQKENILLDVVSEKDLDKFKNEHKKSEINFINRSMQIINFEREMYKNPDQNLGKLWHGLKCKYCGKNEKEEINNEWATVPHYLSHPAYYQNYFRANIMKAQMYKHLTKELGSITENKNTAEYLNKNLFKLGTSMPENDLIESFTGEKLSTKSLCDSIK